MIPRLKKYLPLILSIALSLGAVLLYFLLAKDWQKMWHGTQGDELFVSAFLNRVVHGQYFSDFYTGWLSPFYPPLYFWLTGTIARLAGAANGITAAKIGVMTTFIVWFLGSYLFQSAGWKLIGEKGKSNKKISNPLFYILFPLLFFFLIDFTDIITKPYEAITAMLCVIFLWLFTAFLSEPPLLADARSKEGARGWLPSAKPLLFFGVSGGLLFLTYYFWWLILIPVLFIIALSKKSKQPSPPSFGFEGGGQGVVSSFFFILIIGAVMILIASPYLIPLISTYTKLGMENWQPLHFVYSDLTLYAPWLDFSIPGLFYLIGFATIILELTKHFTGKKSAESAPSVLPPLILSNALILLFCYLYFFINIIIFFIGKTPWQTSKPFYFLGGAALISSAAYGLSTIYHLLSTRRFIRAFVSITILILLLIPTTTSLTTNYQLHTTNSSQSPAKSLAADIKNSLPDAESKVWLSSGYPELNAYINLNYYVAHNAHFSHPASHFSQRLESIRAFVSSTSPAEFTNQLSKANPPITAILLYYNQSTNTYPLFFRVDDFGNGSKEVQMNLDPKLLQNLTKIYDKNNWSIWIIK